MLSLSSGAPGCGKSSQHKFLASVLPDTRYVSLEYKDIEMLKNSGINYVIIEKFDGNYLEDPIATLAALELETHDIITSNKYKNVIVDGVSDIRKFAMQEWIYKDNQVRARQQQKPRESISGENKSAWHEINERTMHLLRPIINWANVTRNNVFFTAQLKDNYVNDKKVGKAINIGEWCEYDVDCKFEFSRPTLEQYKIRITKLPDWATDEGVFDLDVGRNDFLTILSSSGLIK